MNQRPADDHLWRAYLLSDGEIDEQTTENLLRELERQLTVGETSLADAVGQIGRLQSAIKTLTPADVADLESQSPATVSRAPNGPVPVVRTRTARPSRFAPLAVATCLLAVTATALCLVHPGSNDLDRDNPRNSARDTVDPALDPAQIARAWKMTRGAWSSERLSDDLWEIAVAEAPDIGETVSDCRQVPGWMLAALSSEELDRQLQIPTTGEAN